MQQVAIKVIRKEDQKALNKEPLELKELWISEGSTRGAKATYSFHFTDRAGKEYACETSARVADGIAGAIVGAELQFRHKPLGVEESRDYFGIFHRMKEKLCDLYFKTPDATPEGWLEYSKDIVIDKMIMI